MFKPWKRTAGPLVFLGLALLALTSMMSDRGSVRAGGRDLPWWEGLVVDAIAGVQAVVSAPVDGVRDTWAGYVDLLDVRERNLGLEARVAVLEEDALQYREALVASGHLERIAEMRADYEIAMLPTKVVGFGAGLSFRSLLVDRGRADGVRPGQPVIHHDGVVGLVTATSGGAARSMLILDPQSSIDAIVQRSRVRGMLRGRGTGSLDFEFATRGGDVLAGDVVLTSGLGGVYPKGLRLGAVTEGAAARGQLLRRAQVEPGVDFGRLEQVFVMLFRAPSMELLYGAGEGREETAAR